MLYELGDVPEDLKTTEKVQCRLGAVILNYRTSDLTIGCLASLAGELEMVDGRAAVVDNFSDDGSAENISAWIAQSPLAARAQLIRSSVNSGFSGGCNRGIAALDADFYLLLNSDARIREGALGALLSAADRHPEAGAIAPRLEFEDGTPQSSCFRFISPMSEFIAGAASGPISRMLRPFQVAPPVPKTVVEIDWASFACILLRKEAIRAAGPMDEGYFMYFEDADYCRQLANAGWKVIYDPAPRVVHLRGGSSPVKAALASGGRPPAYFYEARTRYFRKVYGPFGPFAANIMWLLGRGLARLRPLSGRAAPGVCEKQGVDIWTNWRHPLRAPRTPAES